MIPFHSLVNDERVHTYPFHSVSKVDFPVSDNATLYLKTVVDFVESCRGNYAVELRVDDSIYTTVCCASSKPVSTQRLPAQCACGYRETYGPHLIDQFYRHLPTTPFV